MAAGIAGRDEGAFRRADQAAGDAVGMDNQRRRALLDCSAAADAADQAARAGRSLDCRRCWIVAVLVYGQHVGDSPAADSPGQGSGVGARDRRVGHFDVLHGCAAADGPGQSSGAVSGTANRKIIQLQVLHTAAVEGAEQARRPGVLHRDIGNAVALSVILKPLRRTHGVEVMVFT